MTEKSNEITAVPALLRQLELAGCIVTAAALHCRRNIAKEITEADADYVLALKGNQGTVQDEVRAYLADAIARQDPELSTLTTVDKGHGRLETRRYWQSERLAWFADREKWPGLRSLPVDVATFARAVRGHWAVENQLHRLLDVVFSEDQSRARSGHSVANLGLVRRLALNLLRRDKTCKRRAKGKQLNDALNPDYLLRLLTAASSVRCVSPGCWQKVERPRCSWGTCDMSVAESNASLNALWFCAAVVTHGAIVKWRRL